MKRWKVTFTTKRDGTKELEFLSNDVYSVVTDAAHVIRLLVDVPVADRPEITGLECVGEVK